MNKVNVAKKSHSVNFNDIVPSRKCDHCGKEFCLQVGATFDEYAYKEYRYKGTKYYCSWRCLQASRPHDSTVKIGACLDDFVERSIEFEARKKRQLALVLPLREQGYSMLEIARQTGITYGTVRARLTEVKRNV